MSKLLFALATVGLLFVALPSASAQDIGVSVGERGVRVGVGDNDRRYRDHRRSRHIYTGGRRSGCVTVTTRKRLPNGNVIIKKSQRC